MSAAILYFTHGIGDFGNSFAAKISRSFHKIGYLRAAGELSRAGYQAEADKCYRLARSL
jgi:hypothetical protein